MSIIGILYVPLQILYVKNQLVPLEKVILNIEKSHTRIPYYKFNVQGSPIKYYNSGNGFLSFLKNDGKLLKENINENLDYYINKKDLSINENSKDIFYIGLNKKNVFIDIFYSHFTGFGKFLFFLFCIFIMCLNIYGIYIIKNKIFEIFLTFYIFYSIIILIL